MKRTISLLLLCMIWFVASAQQHMKFMGIPLDGTITTFTTKLQAKGVKISPNNSKSGAGCRWFVGSFFGQSAEIYVYYNPTTKIVYRAKAVIERDKFEQLKAEGVIQDGMIPKLENAFDAIRAGVKQVIITKADAIGKNEGTTIIA